MNMRTTNLLGLLILEIHFTGIFAVCDTSRFPNEWLKSIYKHIYRDHKSVSRKLRGIDYVQVNQFAISSHFFLGHMVFYFQAGTFHNWILITFE
ncbi:hypothetical protein CVS40_1265 [Lucilia cuprina]|nr:hypothetical protein CVS40_1265 [Lucilia cuprina]